MGMYGPILGAFVSWVEGLKVGVFDFAAFRIVASMAVGIALGALLFARVVRYLLLHYREGTIATLVGFMVGALRSVWPFWSTQYDSNQVLKVISPQLPDFFSLFFAASFGFFVLGVSLVFFVEYLASRRGVKKRSKLC